MDRDSILKTKLHARLHDPAEKALVLLRDPAGHEGGTSRALHRLLGYQTLDKDLIETDDPESLCGVLFKDGIPRKMYDVVRRADRWAAAADRPQWPMDEITVSTRAGELRTFKVARWAQVEWSKQPVLIHPLTGEELDLKSLVDTELADLKARSFAHFSSLVARDAAGAPDWQRSLLAFWRFGPELREADDAGKLGALWPMLPADTRVPDHSIWDHLDLASAFAGAFAADPDGEAALLTMSIGPVQGFIEAARSTSDLWAGSHLLARLAWETMKSLCIELGPDAILFPKLRGIPQVDLWLRDEMALDASLFERCEWQRSATDANPLFSAALPNRFVAIVPRSRAESIANEATRAVRAWLAEKGHEVVLRLLQEAGLPDDDSQYCFAQMRTQLEGFPEVNWAVVPFSLAKPRDRERETDIDTSVLAEAMAPFFGAQPGQASGFLNSHAWSVLTGELDLEGKAFFSPNPGTLYPAIHELAERTHAAAKAARPFQQTEQRGWRCSLTGETEWLTTDPAQLDVPPGQRKDTLWTRIAAERPAWAKKREHLGGLSAVKRLWPTLFAEEMKRAIGCEVSRFVVSTHTMALAHQMEQALFTQRGPDSRLAALIERHLPGHERVALPRKLEKAFRQWPLAQDLKLLPALLDLEDSGEELDERAQREIAQIVKSSLGAERLETYYGLLMMDGDRMGGWLAGDHAIDYEVAFHPQVRTGFRTRAAGNAALEAYAKQPRAISPSRHLAISGALNDFSLHVARHVIEVEHLGRVIYAGGDDVLAMLPVADLLPAMQRLRVAYSGGKEKEQPAAKADRLTLGKGFAYLDGRLMRMMGSKATASCGAVVAHHQAPLAAVLRELRAAEQRAKLEEGRDAFSITLIKRSGGAVRFGARWGAPVAALNDVAAFLREPTVSRRAVYNALDWIKDLPSTADVEMLGHLLAHQWSRQSDQYARNEHAMPELCNRVGELAIAAKTPLKWLAEFLIVAEFLARETRSATGDRS
ncbi:MAG: type III-B CRISPR-associated protein Cas10/Cmr2 [Burkholderiales bacterium]|nr:type III-B CRISPR-associated protein Cas10/Cmr2 [Burkholderiales bacterium]